MSFCGFDRIIFWQYIPSPHQIPTLERFAELMLGVEVLLVCEQSMDQSLLDLGWQSVEDSQLTIVVKPDGELVQQLADKNPLTTLHVLNSLYYVDMVKRVYERLLKNGAKFGLLSEGREYLGVKGLLRVLQSRVLDRTVARHCDFVLAMGAVGVSWYTKVGYAQTKVLNYGYTPAIATAECVDSMEKDFVVLFVGRLEARKRVDLLLRAVASLDNRRLTVRIIGGGQEENKLKSLSTKLGLSDQIEWCGVIPNHQLGRELSPADLLILPSRWDGWGAVVNEALLSGTPAVVSDCCGASDLLESADRRLGGVFHSGSVTSLASSIRSQLALGKVSREQREAVRRWALDSISGDALAQYLFDALTFVYGGGQAKGSAAPVVPWKVKSVGKLV